MFVVAVKFIIKAQAWQTFLPMIQTNAEASLQEEECYQFDVCVNPEQQQVFLYEVYANQAAFDVHLATEHFLTFNQQTLDMIEAKEIETYQQVL